MQTQNAAPVIEGKKSFGPLVGVIIIVILLILGAYYMMRGDESAPAATDDVSAIETELQAGAGAETELTELESL